MFVRLNGLYSTFGSVLPNVLLRVIEHLRVLGVNFGFLTLNNAEKFFVRLNGLYSTFGSVGSQFGVFNAK